MGVPVQEDVPGSQRREIFQVVDVPVRRIDEPLADRQDTVIRHHREIQHHLVHLGFAVAPHAAELRLQAVQQRDDLFRGIFAGQVVAGAVIEQVAQKEQTVRPLPLEGGDHLAAIVR